MSIDYDTATQAASGEIWDLDGNEQFAVTALDENQNVLATLTSPSGGLDGEPWTWSFLTDKGAEIATIDLEYISNRANPQGFIFDNFDLTGSGNAEAQAAPLPVALPLGLLGMLAVVWHKRFVQRGRTRGDVGCEDSKLLPASSEGN